MSCTQNCRQGRDCVCTQACELPEVPVQKKPVQPPKTLRYTQAPARRGVPTWFKDVLACAVAVLAIVWLLGYYGPSLDAAPDSPVVTDAQAAAMHVYMEELAVAKACRFEHGESLIRRTANGGFVCIPRKHLASK